VVGIVVVSHSRALARAAVGLAEEMLQGRDVPIVIAAGLDEQTFGTDAVQIHAALLEADRDGDGVVVLMDLGSAVLSAELALELLDDDAARARVLLCPAPLVEGLVVAAVAALSGAGAAAVAAEAVNALAGKQSQLGGAEIAGSDTAGSDPGAHGAERVGSFRVLLAHGLHARPAARLVQLVQAFDARLELRNATTGSGWVPGASLSRVATLGALPGHDVEVRAAGPQGEEALEQVLALAGRNFDERSSGDEKLPPGDTSEAAESDAGAFEPTGGPFGASPGIGIGPARLDPALLAPGGAGSVDVTALAGSAEPGRPGSGSSRPDPVVEKQQLKLALVAVQNQLQTLRAQVAAEISGSEAEIFDAHLALLADPELRAEAEAGIDAGQAAGRAWAQAVSKPVAQLEALADPYLRARAADLRAVGNQVLAELLGRGETSPDQAGPGSISSAGATGSAGSARPPGVLVAADLTPAQAAVLNPAHVIAVVLAYGSPTAHSAILARARGIPAVVGAGAGVLSITEGTPIAVDGTTGELVIDPPEAILAAFAKRAQVAEERDREALTWAGAPSVTRDGVVVAVGANVGSIEDAEAAAASGADLIGLVRTEFLFLGRARPPDLAEQEDVYRALAAAFPGRRLTLRTLDVGGDKPLDYLPMPAEANPFLGVRGLRLAFQRPRLLADQLLAIVRVAHDVPVSLMFPMVSTLDELLRARRFLDDAIKQAGRGEPEGFRVGIMVEVPAAALKAAVFAPHVDFLSIGTNDLTQYALAAERGNDAVAALGDPLDPGVLRLIQATCAGGPDTPVAVCGELAADERATSLLVGLGVRELSVTPRAVPGIKQAVRELRLPEAAALAGRALDVASADAVRELLVRP
jgi:phosphocarrier protein FPr